MYLGKSLQARPFGKVRFFVVKYTNSPTLSVGGSFLSLAWCVCITWLSMMASRAIDRFSCAWQTNPWTPGRLSEHRLPSVKCPTLLWLKHPASFHRSVPFTFPDVHLLYSRYHGWHLWFWFTGHPPAAALHWTMPSYTACFPCGNICVHYQSSQNSSSPLHKYSC